MKLITKNIGLGKRIKAIRVKLGKSQAEFGELFDPPAPKGAVSRWEHGGGPNKKRLKKIADLGNVSVDYLINGSRLSNKEIRSLIDKAKAGLINDEDRQKMVEASIDKRTELADTVDELKALSLNQAKKQEKLIDEHPLSVLDLLIYADFLTLFNRVRLYGSKEQQGAFAGIITALMQTAIGGIEYDEKSFVDTISPLLSSFPVDNKDSDSSKSDDSK